MYLGAGAIGSLVAVILGSLSVPLLADDVESGVDGEQIVPVDSKAIRMASERVDVYVTWAGTNGMPVHRTEGCHSDMRVEAEFVLENESNQPQSILVSFPYGYGIDDFSRTVDGKPTKVERRDGVPFGNVSKIEFAPGQTRRVRIKYSAYPDASSDHSERWSYILKTGANWKGTIGKATVVIHFPGNMPYSQLEWGGRGTFRFEAVEMNPSGYRIDEEARTATWEFEDFEPSDDIQLSWSARSAMCASDPFAINSKKEAAALLLRQGQSQSPSTKALQAFATLREFFPDSPEANRVDLEIARVLSRHSVWFDHRGVWRVSTRGLDAKRAMSYYEAALKTPLPDGDRADAIAELFILCSTAAPDAAKAQQCIELIRAEKVAASCNNGVLLKVAAVSPAKALALLAAVRDEYGAGTTWGVRANIERLQKAHPDGIVTRKQAGQTQPAVPKPAMAEPSVGVSAEKTGPL